MTKIRCLTAIIDPDTGEVRAEKDGELELSEANFFVDRWPHLFELVGMMDTFLQQKPNAGIPPKPEWADHADRESNHDPQRWIFERYGGPTELWL